MKIDMHKARSESNPDHGVKVSAAEQAEVNTLARLLAASGLSDDDLAVIRQALAVDAIRHERAWEWTEMESTAERHRRSRHERLLLLYRAAQMAYFRVD